VQVVVFTGGGTGGHVYPGIALAQALMPRVQLRLVWIGSKTGIERQVIEGLGWEYQPVSTGKLRRYLDWRNVTDLFRIVAGYFQARKLLTSLKPTFVFSKGGFVSVPPVRAARSLGIPVYSHESDLDPGLATRLNLGSSSLLFVAYEATKKVFSAAVQKKIVVSGNPVRSDFFTPAATPLSGLFPVPVGAPVLVVLGGSLGALQVNTLLQRALPELEGKVFVVHQTGSQWLALPDTPWYVSRAFFSTQMPALLQGATLVFGRSGAGTLWEAAACNVPLLLLPLGEGSRGDQGRNAAHFASHGAAIVLDNLTTPGELAEQVIALVNDAARRSSMGQALAKFGARQASSKMAEVLLERHPELKAGADSV
jgi:UDP-N-acetylglucosamine--N-acetylmuramyl-(pentapeptide) pyrophosphoryl-undecaprenol N-acetylglucosamine transferase